MFIPLFPGHHIEAASDPGATGAVTIDMRDFYARNCVASQYPNGKMYITQRPPIRTSLDASATVAKVKGRGIYYWQDAAKTYIVNDDTVYYTNYSNACTTSSGTFSGSEEKVKILELGDEVIILDAFNNKGWTINVSTSTVLDPIGGSFPSTFRAGGAVLNGYAFVIDEDGAIWNSNLNDATTWSATDFITAEREEDKGVYLEKHHDHLVAFGARTTEFFYDAGNPTESPLARREDVFYHVGIFNVDCCAVTNDVISFLGISDAGGMGVYQIVNFGLKKISDETLDQFLEDTSGHSWNFYLESVEYSGRQFVFLSADQVSRTAPSHTFVWDGLMWAEWDTDQTGLTSGFPVIGKSLRSGSGLGFHSSQNNLIMANGDVLIFEDPFGPSEGTESSPRVQIRTGSFDADTTAWKFMRSLEVRGQKTANSSNATIKWADGNSDSFSSGLTLDLSVKNRLTRLGRFERRNLEFNYTGDEQLRIEGFDVEIAKGTY